MVFLQSEKIVSHREVIIVNELKPEMKARRKYFFPPEKPVARIDEDRGAKTWLGDFTQTCKHVEGV